MKLIRIGWRVFNMSALIQARVLDDETVLYFAAPEGGTDPYGMTQVSPYYTRLNREETAAFKIWLEDNSDLVMSSRSAPAPTTSDDIPF